MIINVFIPINIYTRNEDCDLYGELKIEQNCVSYFVISTQNTLKNKIWLWRKIGCIVSHPNQIQTDVPLTFQRDANNQGNFLLNTNIYYAATSNKMNCNIYVYDKNIHKLSMEMENCPRFDINFLLTLFNSNQTNLCSKICNKFNIESMKYISQTKLYKKIKYYISWNSYVDVLFGVMIMLLLLSSMNLADEILSIAQGIIFQLRLLLQSLKGNPVGLKLNLQLNNFLLKCFTYHIDLWSTFLTVVYPVVRNIFIPLFAVCGILGLSRQISLFLYIVSFLSLHAHCFYIYTAILYKIEVIGIKVLWKMALGKRKNTLKNRLETSEQLNRQCYLTILFLTCLLFVMPTIAVYYIVFVFVRTLIFLLRFILLKLRSFVLYYAANNYILWIYNYWMKRNQVDIKFVTVFHRPNLPITSVFQIQLLRGRPSMNLFSNQKSETNQQLSPSQYIKSIVNGNIVKLNLNS